MDSSEPTYTLLIVDDNSQNIELLAHILQKDYKVKAAKNGFKAIELARSGQPDLILLDVEMPEMNGYEVCRQLQADTTTKDIPVIFVTARTDEFDEEKGLELGAVDYIKKPYRPIIIRSRIQTHLRIKTQQQQLKHAHDKNSRYLEIIDRYVLTCKTNLEGLITDVSQALCELSGYQQQELIGKTPTIFKSNTTEAQTYQELWQKITQGQVWQGELLNRTKDGRQFWLDMSILPDYDDQQRIIGYTSIATDITSKKLIQKIADLDKLTQLYNRNKLDVLLEREYSRSLRYGNPLSMILLDIDHFKAVNDTYGHPVGDSVLIEIAQLLKQNSRTTDFVGRWGGEEFMIICVETTQQGAYKTAEHIRQVIEHHQFLHVDHKTASFGLAELGDGDKINDLIARADQALYRAKQEGRNRVCQL
jgi:diguanylate cyclase (GGDEF)-like protein/PAS domain S-box-containing protein